MKKLLILSALISFVASNANAGECPPAKAITEDVRKKLWELFHHP